MKILVSADLHYRSHWFHWLSEQAANFDLICIAGDLLDMFKGAPRMEQAREVSRWIRELSKVTWVAVCSGNHDNAGRQILADRAPVYDWLVSLGREPKIITDGATQVVNDLIVTTVPYHCSKEQKSVWLDRGYTIRRQRGGPWLVLHHIPPIAYPRSTKEEGEAAELMIQYRPDYFVSGHSHQFPYSRVTVGRYELATSRCSRRGSYWARISPTTSSWTRARIRWVGMRQAWSGSRKRAFLT